MEEEKPSSKEEAAGVSMMRTAETFLRVAPMGLCIGAMVVMVGNSEDNDYGSVSYSNLSAFTYLVYTNGICAAYSLFSLILTAMPRPPSLPRAWSVFFCDQVLTYVVLAAGVVSSEILYLAYNGDEKVTWSKQCGIFGGFCKKATTSVGITFGTVVCYVLLSLISSYRLFSTFDAPIPSLSNKGGTEISAFPLSSA